MWALYLPLVIPALAGMTSRWMAARLEPRLATWLLTAAAVALAACSTAALALLVAYAAARIPALAALGDYSPHVVRRGDPISALTGAAAGLALAARAWRSRSSSATGRGRWRTRTGAPPGSGRRHGRRGAGTGDRGVRAAGQAWPHRRLRVPARQRRGRPGRAARP